jgi:hypothetical protein
MPGAARGTAALAVIVALAVTAGCSSGPADPPAAPGASVPTGSAPAYADAPEGLSLTLIQTRSLEGTDRAQIEVVNQTPADLAIERVGLDWAGFPGDPQPFSYLVPAGLTYDLPFELPEPVCTPEARAETAYAVAGTGDAVFRTPLDESGLRFRDRLWQTACDEQAIGRVLSSLEYGDRWRTEGRGRTSTFTGHVTLTRGPEDPAVTLAQTKGSVLFGLRLPGDTTLPTGDPSADLPLQVRPGRCDEHARSQSTQTFVWRFWIAIGDAPPISHIVSPPEPLQERFLAFLDRACRTDGR